MVPKPDSPVGRTSYELSQVQLVLALLHHLNIVLKADHGVVGHDLDFVNGTTVRHEGAIDRDLIELLNVPNKHHPV